MVTQQDIRWEEDSAGEGAVDGFYGNYVIRLIPLSDPYAPLVGVSVRSKGERLFQETRPVAKEAIDAALDFLNERFRISDEEREHAVVISMIRRDTLAHIKTTVGIVGGQ